MNKTITSNVLVGYSQCPYKAYLLLCTRIRGTRHEYTRILEKQRHIIQSNYIKNLWQTNDDVQSYNPENLKGKHKFLVNVTFEAGEVSAKCAALTKVRPHSVFGHYSYEPTIVVSSRTVKKEHRLEMFFFSHVLERVQEKRPVTGRIVGLDGKSHRVKLENGPKTLIPYIEPLQEWVAEDKLEPPTLILNKHCPICQFDDLCRKKAVKEDHLSLLNSISTQKAINRWERKGIFTVEQLSYTFRPRKRRKRIKNPSAMVHKPELQALAIREKKIYLQEFPELTRQPVELFLDIEGVPDQQFYYLIGLLVSDNGITTYHPFWADTPVNEVQIWQQFVEKANQYPDTPIYHYGSFEPRTLKKLGRRYDTEVEELIKRLVNVNKHIFGKVYFPIYSNRLKEIGTFIGATWTAPNASGLQSLVWRHNWKETRSDKYKSMLLTYNEEDCQALKLLTDELSKIKHTADKLSEVDFADQPKRPATQMGKEVHTQFEAILKFANANYDKNKIRFRQVEKIQHSKQAIYGAKKGYQGQRKIKPKATKNIELRPDQFCPRCGYEPIPPTKYRSRRLIIDFILTKNGIKKTITEYIGIQGYCSKCGRNYAPSKIRNYGANTLYGHGLKAWVIYQRVAMRLPYESIAEGMRDQFNDSMPSMSVGQIIRDFGRYYLETNKQIVARLLESHFIHVDETPVSIRGVTQYVWVFTDGNFVAFKLGKTREASIVHEFLGDYNGILISDFYAGYDSANCEQQKCWVHLIRTINDDLWKAPFDSEFEDFALAVRNLIIPIMETVQKCGLKKRNLNKFRKQVVKFYDKVIVDKYYKSEFAIKYQKRFLKYRSSLFTFLEYNSLPWNNNTAERAIRHIAKQRVISGSFHEAMMHHYLVLLSIRQTCRFQGKSFIKFLFSGETDLDNFEARKRKRRP